MPIKHVDRRLMITGGVALLALATAACGAGATSSSLSGSPASATPLGVANTSLGKVLVDAAGRTVYTFTSDTPNHSTCTADCLQFWPAVTPSAAKKSPGVVAKINSTTTPTGEPITTVDGSPVYTFSLDSQPGDVSGEGNNKFGGTWYAVAPDGQSIKSDGGTSSPSPDNSQSSSTGSRYSY